MSSKVFDGSGPDNGVTPYAWRKVASKLSDAGAASDNGQNLIDSLTRRLAKLESEIAQREQQVRDEGRQAGYQAGRTEGEAAARTQAAEELRAAVGRIADIAKEMLGWRRQIRNQLEEDLVHLAVAIARRVLHRELTVDEGALLGIIHVALTKIDVRELTQIRVSAKDREIIQGRLALDPLPVRIEVIGDATLPRGSLIFETARGNLDCSIEAQLQEIDRGLADVVRRSK